MGVWHIILSNLKKKKGNAFVLGLLVFLAITFMNIGMNISGSVGSFFDKKAEALKAPHFMAVSSINTYKESYEQFFKQDERTQVFEKEEVVHMDKLVSKETGLELSAYIFNANQERQIAPLMPTESLDGEEGIYLPSVLKGYGCELGEPFNFEYKNKKYSYKIVGFFETAYYGTTYGADLKYFLTQEAYEKLYEEVGAERIMSVTLKDVSQVNAYREDFITQTGYGKGASDLFAQSKDLTSQSMRAGVTAIVSVIATMLIAFSIILTLVVLVVIRFKVNEYIEINMRNIGTLQALGYTHRQIASSIIGEFLVITSIGGVLGTVAAYGIKPLLNGILTKASGLTWENSFTPIQDISVALIIIGLVVVIALIATGRVYQLPPVVALRKGIETHYFKKNIFPLHKLFGSIHLRLAFKQLVMNMKQNVMMATIITVGTFAMGVMMITYANFAFDHTAFYTMVGIELCDVQVKVAGNTDAKQFAKELEGVEGVRKTNLSDIVGLKIEGVDVQCIVSDQFEAMEVLRPYKGEFPKYDNEIVITGKLANELGKTIGDAVKVNLNGVEKEYLITGLSQTTNAGGNMGIIHLEGVHELLPQFNLRQIDVYVEKDVPVENVIKYLETTYKVAEATDKEETTTEQKYAKAQQKAEEKIAKLLAEYGVDSMEYAVMVDGKIVLSGNSSLYKIEKITNMYAYLQNQLKTYASMMSSMVTVMIVVTFIIIAAILSMIIKSMISNKKEEYGVYKAMGYTTFELMNQLSLSFMIVAIVGVTIGTILSFTCTAFLLGGLFYQMGITQMTFAINPGMLIGLGVAVIVFIYMIAMTITYRIRKITVYELLTE